MVALLLSASFLLCSTANAQAAQKQVTPTLSVSASPASVSPNNTSKIILTLKAQNKAVKDATVAVQERYQGGKQWKTIARVKTDTSGKATISTPKHTKNAEYRAVYSGSRTLKPKTSGTQLVTVKQSVTVTKTSPVTTTAGTTITLSGTTSPALANHTASLQLLSGKTWKTVGRATVTSKKTFTVSGKATQGGKRSYRVWVQGGIGIANAGSSTKTFNITYRDVTVATLQSAEVPAACTMPAQRLQHGETKNWGKPGPNGMLSFNDPGPVFADVAGLGYKQAVAVYYCSAGGVGWPPVIVLTGSGGALLGHVNLDTLTYRANGDRGFVEAVGVDRGNVTVRWTSTSGCCSNLTKHRTLLRQQGRKLVVVSDTITK